MTNRRPAALILVLCLAALGACGGMGSSAFAGTKTPTPAQFKIASTSTLDAHSFRFAVNLSMNGLGAFSGEGVQDLERGRTSFKMSLGGGTGSATMEELVSGTTIYVKSPIFRGVLPAGKSWVKLDLGALGNQLGVDFGKLLDQASTADAQGPVNFLRGVDGHIENVGTEIVRGTKTTHYKLTVDLSKAAANLPANLAAQVKPLFDRLGVETFPVDAWIDKDGLVRKIRYSADLSSVSGGAAGAPGAITTTMELFDFGAKVDSADPTASQVVDLKELLNGLIG